MRKGAKVICVDDKFDPLVLASYRALPKKDGIYTIRDVMLGKNVNLTSEGEVAVLLEEITNPTYNDPAFHKLPIGSIHELAFNAERFREIEPPKVEEKEEEIVHHIEDEPELVPVEPELVPA